MLKKLFAKIRLFGLRSKEPLIQLSEILGFEPENKGFYDLAFRHSSCSLTDENGSKINNERLEFLGDSVLATSVSYYLYDKYPEWDEGRLSQRRGALVKRTVNNAVARELHLDKMLVVRQDVTRMSPDIYGNTLEALIGAIFLDKGYDVAQSFVFKKVLPAFKEMETSLTEQTTNYKSVLLEWVQKHHLNVEFRMLQEPKRTGGVFMCAVLVDDQKIGTGKGQTKKEAHQKASQHALEILCKVSPEVKHDLETKS
ncbi:ribonuclease III [Porphyromonas pogonae]|uniref:ribonuclease III n=1 Tax=Porphyromonas pogonae TaxID=867595 RepID=UPI002E79917F|nr:ribonuclease III [Porphyromonas pogonae]